MIYTILTTQRTGSSLLDEILRNTQMAGVPREYFLHYRDYNSMNLNSSYPLKKFMQKKIIENTINGNFGIKIMRSQYNIDIKTRDVFFDVFPSAKIIHLYREDKVAQALSLHMATKTDVWKGVYPESSYRIDNELLSSVINYLKKIVKWEKEWELFLQNSNSDHVDISYEDLINSPNKSLCCVLKHLGIESKIINPNYGSFVKQMPSLFLQNVKNEL